MPNFAVIENDKVIEIVAAEYELVVQKFFPEKQVLLLDESLPVAVNKGYLYIDNKFTDDVKPFASWVLKDMGEFWTWEAPVPRPADHEEKLYLWDEEALSWVSPPEQI